MTGSSSFLVDLPDSALWSSRTWRDFASRENAAPHPIAVLPLFGFADWGLGRPLDLEEVLGTAVLREAIGVSETSLSILPPLRFVHAPYPHTCFGVDFATASDLLREIAGSLATARIAKLVLFNTSPWNEDLTYASGCDLRVETGLQVYRINLAALGLDLHPIRSPDRGAVQCAACACFGSLPAPEKRAAQIRFAGLRPARVVQPGSVDCPLPLDEAGRRGATLIRAAGEKLAQLLREVDEHTLPHPAKNGITTSAPAST